MTAFAMRRQASSGTSLKGWILRGLVVGAMAVTALYAKTIGLFLKVFFKELFAGSKPE